MQLGERNSDRIQLEAAVHRQFMAHFEVSNKDIHMSFTIGVQIDLAFRAIEEIELPVRFVAHFQKEWLDLFAFIICNDKIKVAVFARKELLKIPAPHTDTQPTDRA